MKRLVLSLAAAAALVFTIAGTSAAQGVIVRPYGGTFYYPGVTPHYSYRYQYSPYGYNYSYRYSYPTYRYYGTPYGYYNSYRYPTYGYYYSSPYLGWW